VKLLLVIGSTLIAVIVATLSVLLWQSFYQQAMIAHLQECLAFRSSNSKLLYPTARAWARFDARATAQEAATKGA
jgi:hypothetical protein